MFRLFSRRGCGSFALLGALLAAPLACQAQAYPTRPIHLVVPFPPGGVADLIARPIADKISKELGQPVIVDNHGGATGTIGAALVANSQPDGYTLLFGTTNEIAMSPTLYKSLPYNPVKSFAPIMPVAEFPNVLVVSPMTDAKSFAELIELAKARKKSLSFASSGVGSTNHLTAEIFKSLAKVNILHVPYKGGGPALIGLIGGQVDAMFATLPSAITMIRGGKLKALAVTGERRSPALPDVPTAKEAGMPGLVVTTWNGVLAPAGTPDAVVDRVHRALLLAVADPDIKKRLAAVGAETMSMTPQAFAALIHSDFDRWSEVIKGAGIKAE
ncbi:tripartite tricarboxylate transporter substrate binding protein [Paralcaligenes sp. KSB-10]|uniref:Bug family tripartite tricarboxylate transporter substrate binding protein n=1 Tax=Paralcaligenes sp. KSB-10 TaxID=2901142 RepID=UPI001E3A2821|nr:tripartite tricarboxylate transporter substrate binding protein [Paralcaligenes sp. KSB-10]UHL63851.1 tripartite tricarboxylate transporter substrate binding protein [Paralcaligenes sp. KSB-10]